MIRFVTIYTRDEGVECWLRIKMNLILTMNEALHVERGNISFFVCDYEIDTLYSSCNWKDFFKTNKAGERLTIEVANKNLDVRVEFSKKNILPY